VAMATKDSSCLRRSIGGDYAERGIAQTLYSPVNLSRRH
jgi:hypothetical protein